MATVTHIMSDETGQQVVEKLEAISKGLGGSSGSSARPPIAQIMMGKPVDLTAGDLDGITMFDSQTYENCYGLEYFTRSIQFPDSCLEIGTSAFMNFSQTLERVDIGDGVKVIQESAFSGCYEMTSLRLGASLETIGQLAFSGCNGLTSIDVPDNVKTIISNAFAVCEGLRALTIGDGVSMIASELFSDCSNLEFLSFGAGVTKFQAELNSTDFPKLVSVHFKSAVPPVIDAENGGAISLTKGAIYVPSSSVDAYKAADGWQGVASLIVGE